MANLEYERIYNRMYRKVHPELYLAADRRKRAKNPELYRALDREKQRRYRLSPSYRLKQSLYRRIHHALRGDNKSASTIKLLGCSIENFKLYLESKFEIGMSWDNYGKWQIDHIVPCALFDLSKSKHQKSCFHFSNMQPMWSIKNQVKGKKVQIHG